MEIEKELIVGVLHISSKTSYGLVKNGTVKLFTSHQRTKYYVKTKKEYQVVDVYVIIKKSSERINDGDLYTVEQYIGNVGDLNSEYEYMKQICCVNWMNNKKIILDDEIHSKRIDLTHINSYSIDPKGCIDIDDAIGFTRDGDKTTVYVHIADVTSYVKPNSQLDKELQRRVSSVYLHNTFHMLPPQLVETCSLIEGQRKNGFTCIINYDENYVFNMTSYTFAKSVVKVIRNLSYDEADKFYELEPLYKISKTNDSHKMVEYFMVIANKFAAQELVNKNKNYCLLRSMKQPNIVYDDLPEHVKNMQNTAASYKLGEENSYHSGLELQYYTHFTSPIRRYADIIVHRMLHSKDTIDVTN